LKELEAKKADVSRTAQELEAAKAREQELSSAIATQKQSSESLQSQIQSKQDEHAKI